MSWLKFGKSDSTDPYKYKLDQLERLGYRDLNKNLALLKFHSGDPNKVIQHYKTIQTTSAPWIKLNRLPFRIYGTPMVRNNNEIIIAPTSKYGYRALYKYNHIRDEFIECLKYPINFFSTVYTATIDTEQDIIYIVAYKQLLKIDLKSAAMNYIQITSEYCELMKFNPAVIAINNELHLYARKNDAGWDSYNIHMMYTNNTFNIIDYRQPIFDADRWCQHALLEIKSQNKMLLIGDETCDCIEIDSFDMKTNEWSSLGKIPRMYRFGCTVTKDEKYVIIFGYGSGYSKNIFVINIQHKRIRKSDVCCHSLKCPCGALDKYQVVTVDDYFNNSSIIEYYYRCCLVEDKWNGLPTDLLQLMCSFFCIEYVHLWTSEEDGEIYNEGEPDANHWKMQLNELLEVGKQKQLQV
eukprot:21828_1